jgi:hypothetical protein
MMALKLQFNTKMGVSGEYINFQPNFKGKTTILLHVRYWKDQVIRNVSENIPLNDRLIGSSSDRIIGFKCLYEFTYDLNSAKNVYAQGYDYLKTLKEFAGSEDC